MGILKILVQLREIVENIYVFVKTNVDTHDLHSSTKYYLFIFEIMFYLKNLYNNNNNNNNKINWCYIYKEYIVEFIILILFLVIIFFPKNPLKKYFLIEIPPKWYAYKLVKPLILLTVFIQNLIVKPAHLLFNSESKNIRHIKHFYDTSRMSKIEHYTNLYDQLKKFKTRIMSNLNLNFSKFY